MNSSAPPATVASRLLDRVRPFYPVLLAAAGLLAYHNSFGGVFLLDDLRSIVDNDAVHTLAASWRELLFGLRPLTNLTLAVNYALGGLAPWGYHAVNLAVHVLAGLTLYGLVRRTLQLPAGGSRTANVAADLAFAAALLWLVHPLNTQSVTYVIQRAQALAGLFTLLSLYCLLRGATSPGHGLWWYTGAVAACGLGLASKEDAVVTPLAALAFDRVFLAPSWAALFRRRWALYLAPAACLVVLVPSLVIAFRFHPAGGEDVSAGFGLRDFGPLQYALSQPGVLLRYLGLAAWPRSLCLDYGWPVARAPAEIVPPALVVGALLAATAWALWRRPGLGFLGLWFFLTLAPSSSFLPILDLAVEHRTYLPLASLVVLAVLAGEWALAALRDRGRLTAPAAARLGVVLTVAAAAALGARTVLRNADYQSADRMWSDVLAQRPENCRARVNLASDYLKEGKLDDVIDLCSFVVERQPDNDEAEGLLGIAYVNGGDPEEGIAHLTRAVEVRPNRADHRYNLANALVRVGKTEEAVEGFTTAVQLAPGYAEAHNALGATLGRLGRLQEAVSHLEAAVRLKPGLVDAHVNLAVSLRKQGRLDDARGHNELAVRLAPQSAEAHNQLGLTLQRQGNPAEAAESFGRAADLAPANVRYRCNLAGSLFALARPGAAQAAYREAFRLDPNWPAAANEAAWALATGPDPGQREPLQALFLAGQVCQATGRSSPRYLDTLAAAYAAAGRFEEAAGTAREAAGLAEKQEPGLAEAIRERLRRYEHQEAFVQAPSGGRQ
jgi:tetratricopeptide (TPR) repeat protein